MADRFLVVNADDYGASRGVSEGILDAHVNGIVTSTSLMVYGDHVREAVAAAAEHPELGLGLHWQLDGHHAPDVDLHDPAAARVEMERQLELFQELVGAEPTHVDSHHHVHTIEHLMPIAQELVAPLGVPVRKDGRIPHIGGFYGQWEWGVTDLSHIQPKFLVWMLNNDVGEGWTEFGCHPAFVTGDHTSSYMDEREVERVTLCDPEVRAEVDALGIKLVNFRDYRP